jgi:hypothetical protein
MNKRLRSLIPICIIAVATAMGWFAFGKNVVQIENPVLVSRLAKLNPDYTDTVIPANIAPLNFVVCEPGSRYSVKIHSQNSEPIEVFSRTGKIKIPLRQWRSLLSSNRGGELFFDVYVMDEDRTWSRFETITNKIAKEDIDAYIAYRLIKPIYNYWIDVGIYQRHLEKYDQSPIVHGSSFGYGCVNCHSFLNNRGENMIFGTRSGRYGSCAILVNDGNISRIDTKFGYTAWHPSGQLAAYSFNKVRQFFHGSGMQVRDVVDLDSALCYYTIKSRKVETCSAFVGKNQLETYPAWSPNGKYLYFCNAPMLWTDRNQIPPENYDELKYDLMRISYDIETDKWGEVETVLSAKETGLSVMLPRISPNGRYLLFCMCDYGCFPIYRPSSDLYLMDLKTGEYEKPAIINSKYSESWHSWSSNSRWIAFSSKRRGGLFTRTYISYIDDKGKAHKPFIMPQKDPEFYDSFIKTYSVPELITGPVKVSAGMLGRATRSPSNIYVDIPITEATVKAGSAEPWQERE